VEKGYGQPNMRKPDLVEKMTWKGHPVTVSKWCDVTDIPWDGEFPLEEGSEGWDLFVKVELTLDGVTFSCLDSLGSVWVDAHTGYLDIQQEFIGVVASALVNLQSEIAFVAQGRDIKEAQHRAQVASKVFT
jgi:hypothetical protein